jgi:hypothetical protein
MHVATEAIQLGDGDVAPLFPRCGQCGSELRPAVEGVCALARFDLYELAGDLKTLRLGKLTEGLPLGLYAQPRAALLRRRNSNVRVDRPVTHGHAPTISLYKNNAAPQVVTQCSCNDS